MANPQRPWLLLLCLAPLLQVNLATAMSKERWQDTSLHRDVKHFASYDDPIGDDWYPRNILSPAGAPWHTLRTDCVLLPEEGRPHSSTRDRTWYEDREAEPQLDPHMQRDSTGFGFHSWRARGQSVWSTAAPEWLHDTSEVYPTVADSSCGEDVALERHSVEGASPEWLTIYDFDGRHEFSDNNHSFYHNPQNYAYAIPRTWYHSTPHKRGPLSHSVKLLHGPVPSDITERSEQQQKWNARKQWKTLGCISGDCGKPFQYQYPSDGQVFEQEEDQRSWKEMAEDPEYSEWSYRRPSHDLPWTDKNRYLQEGCSCTHKHGARYHGAGEAVDIGLKNEFEKPAEVPWRIEAASGSKEQDSKPLVLDAVTTEEFYGNLKPEYDQHRTEQHNIPDDIQDDKILVHSEHFPVEADDLLKNTETVPKPSVLDVVTIEEFYGNLKPQYDQHRTEQHNIPDYIQDDKILVHSEHFPVETDDLLKNTETVRKPFVLDTVTIEEFYGNLKPEYDQHRTEQHNIPDDIQDDEILVHSEHFPVEADDLLQNTETVPKPSVLDAVTTEEFYGNLKPEFDQHRTEQHNIPDDIQDDKILVHSEHFPVEADDLLQITETMPKPVVHDAVTTEEFYGNLNPEYDQHRTEQHNIPDDIQDDKILVHSEHFPVKADELLQNTEIVPDGVLDGENVFSGPDSGKQEPEYDLHTTEQDDIPDDTQNHDIFVHSQDFLVEAGELLEHVVTVPDMLDDEKLDSGTLDHVGEMQCKKEDDEFGHYVIRCNEENGDDGGPINTDNFPAETDVTKVEVQEHEGSEPYDQTSVAENESVGNHKWKYDVLEPTKCSKNLAESDNISTEKTESSPIIEITSKESKWDSELNDHASSPVEEFYGKEKTVSEEQFTVRGDDTASLQAHKEVIYSDDFVSEIPLVMKTLSEPEKWKSESQDHIRDHVGMSYGQQHGLFGHREASIKESSKNIKIYDDLLRADKFPGKANVLWWQAKVNPIEEKVKLEHIEPVRIYTDEPYGSHKWEQYATAWKDVLDALKSHKATVQSKSFPGKIVGGAWKTEQTAQKEEWEADFLDQVDISLDDSYYKLNPAWEYYSNARKGELDTSDSVHPIPFPRFAAKEVKTTWRPEEIPDEGTPDIERWQPHNTVYGSIKTESHSALVGGSDAKTLDLEWGSGEESEDGSFPGVKAHGNQKISPEPYSTKGMAFFDAAENQDPIDSETFSVEAAYFPRSHVVVYENEMNRHGTIGHASGAPDGSFRIKRPLEWYKPVNWRTVSDGIAYQTSGAEKTLWDEYVQRGALTEDEAVDRTAPTGRVICDVGTSARRHCNFGTHQLPQKEYVSYASHDTKPTADCEGVIKSKIRTALWRPKVHSRKTTKKWREDVESIALPFEWPTKKIIARRNEYPNGEGKYYTGRDLRGAEDLTMEAGEHSWTVDGGQRTSEEGWSGDGGSSSGEWSDSVEWSSEVKEGVDRSPAMAPLPNMIERLVRVFAEPIKKVACYARKSWKERKAARNRSRGDDAGFEPETAVSPASLPRLRPLEDRKRGRGRLRGLLGRLLAGACGGGAGRTTVHITMPEAER